MTKQDKERCNDLVKEKRTIKRTHLGGVICEAIGPDEVKVVLELTLGFVLLRLYLLKH